MCVFSPSVDDEKVGAREVACGSRSRIHRIRCGTACRARARGGAAHLGLGAVLHAGAGELAGPVGDAWGEGPLNARVREGQRAGRRGLLPGRAVIRGRLHPAGAAAGPAESHARLRGGGLAQSAAAVQGRGTHKAARAGVRAHFLGVVVVEDRRAVVRGGRGAAGERDGTAGTDGLGRRRRDGRRQDTGPTRSSYRGPLLPSGACDHPSTHYSD
jgi:hypothetical protein